MVHPVRIDKDSLVKFANLDAKGVQLFMQYKSLNIIIKKKRNRRNLKNMCYFSELVPFYIKILSSPDLTVRIIVGTFKLFPFLIVDR